MLAVLSLPWPYIAGLGALPALLLAPILPKGEATNLRLLAAVWGFGLTLDYALLLLVRSLFLAMALGALLAVGFGLAGLWVCRDRFRRLPVPKLWIATAILLVIGVFVIVLDPLRDWDARSIWFFHGKMIYYGGMLAPEIGLDLREVPWPQYPMLVPVLAGEVAAVAGFWNEYLPKLALALLLPVPILAVLGLRHRPVTMTLAVLGFYFIPREYLSNGSMDGYLAVYAGAAALFLVDWLERGGDAALLAAAGALGVVGGLKIEGQIVYLAFAVGLVIFLVWHRPALSRPSLPALLLLPLPFAGFILWHALRISWSLPSEPFTFAHAWPRLTDPAALTQIATAVFLDRRVVASFLALVAAATLAWIRGRRLPPMVWLPLMMALAYFAGIFVVLPMSPADLTWQLSAAMRITRTGSALLLVAAIMVLRNCEPDWALPFQLKLGKRNHDPSAA